MRALIISTNAMFCILIAGCGTTQVVEHQTAVPVEKLVYLPIDWTKFQCPDAPQALIVRSTNADLLKNRDAFEVRAQCLADEIDQLHQLK